MADTSIEWTDRTWNPVRGCSRISEGCRNCYAERQAARFSDPGQYAHGFVERAKSGPRWTGKVALVESKLLEPLNWRKPRRVFVNSMSDLFHESLPDQAIDRVFAVMASCQQHTFQVLTKRPERALAWFAARAPLDPDDEPDRFPPLGTLDRVWSHMGSDGYSPTKPTWPLPNVWLGVSVEDQAAADSRIPLLMQTPAAVRFASVEPLIGPIRPVSLVWWRDREKHRVSKPLDWVIIGGESGPGARPCDLEWIRAIVGHCLTSSVPVFVKQLGTVWASKRGTQSKGGIQSLWPEDLRIREFPRTS